MFTIDLKLPHAYNVIAYQRIDDDSGFVLIERPFAPAHPFASYRFDIKTGDCHHGDYIAGEVTNALQRFEARCKGIWK